MNYEILPTHIVMGKTFNKLTATQVRLLCYMRYVAYSEEAKIFKFPITLAGNLGLYHKGNNAGFYNAIKSLENYEFIIVDRTHGKCNYYSFTDIWDKSTPKKDDILQFLEEEIELEKQRLEKLKKIQES